MLRVLLSVVIGGLSVTLVDATTDSPQEFWDRLEHKTGWVLLGDVDTVSREWVTVTSHRIPSRSRPESRGVPLVDEEIVFDEAMPVVIVDFAQTAELRRLDSPAGVVMREDNVAGTLPPGSRVHVRAIRFDPTTRGPQGVWVRVTPSEAK